MAEQQKNSGASEAVEKGAQAAHAVRAAIKTGKAIAGAAKGAAVGGPYGAVAVGLWQNRKTVLKIILAVVFIMLLPILFILMLPSLMYGGLGSTDSPEVPIMNNNTAIMKNITTADTLVRTVMQSSYDEIISAIQADIKDLDDGIKNQVVNPYEGQVIYNCALVISQYCVKQTDYKTIDLIDFQRIVEKGKEHLFSYQKEVKAETVEKEDGSLITTTTAFYTVQYAGEDYFGNTLFALNEEQQEYARYYAENLNLFLDDQFRADANATHDSVSDLISPYPYEWSGEGFHSPFAGTDWQPHITSPFGYRNDPFTGVRSGHTGLDIGLPRGTPIKAAKAGIVVKSVKQNTGYGYHTIINHGNGYTTLYAHCNELLVGVGDTVEAGEVIAKVGTTGRSTGYHLHFEVIKDGQPMDPRGFIG